MKYIFILLSMLLILSVSAQEEVKTLKSNIPKLKVSYYFYSGIDLSVFNNNYSLVNVTQTDIGVLINDRVSLGVGIGSSIISDLKEDQRVKRLGTGALTPSVFSTVVLNPYRKVIFELYGRISYHDVHIEKEDYTVSTGSFFNPSFGLITNINLAKSYTLAISGGYSYTKGLDFENGLENMSGVKFGFSFIKVLGKQ